jgi:chromosome segregation ATPase
MEIDGQRVELVAVRTKLGTALDELARSRREMEELTQAGVDRDGRIALQAVDLTKRDDAMAGLDARLVEAERRARAAEEALLLRPEDTGRSLDAGALAERVAALVRTIDDRDEMIAAAGRREAELSGEIAALRDDAHRVAETLARGAEALRAERQSILSQLDAARADRASLQSEVAKLKREALQSWSIIEDDNRKLRVAMARISAEIARQSALKNGATLSLEAVPEGRGLDAPRLALPEPGEGDKQVAGGSA